MIMININFDQKILLTSINVFIYFGQDLKKTNKYSEVKNTL